MMARDAAQSYIRRGWKPIPVGYKSKRPTQSRWQHRGVTEVLLDTIFPDGKLLNVGVILGGASGGLTDVDLDCTEAIVLAKIVLLKTGAIFGRTSKPESHFLYYTSLATTYGKATLKLSDPNNQKTLLEVRIGGGGDLGRDRGDGGGRGAGGRGADHGDGVGRSGNADGGRRGGGGSGGRDGAGPGDDFGGGDSRRRDGGGCGLGRSSGDAVGRDGGRGGFGCFFVVNKTDGNGLKKENVTEACAVFADLDAAVGVAHLQDQRRATLHAGRVSQVCNRRHEHAGALDPTAIAALEGLPERLLVRRQSIHHHHLRRHGG